MILVDSDIFIDIFRGHDGARMWLEDNLNDTVLSGFVLLELLAGGRSKAEREAQRRYLSQFPLVWLRLQGFERATTTMEEHNPARRPQVLDALIAASAVDMRIPLYTRNLKHFEGIPGLDVRLPGY